MRRTLYCVRDRSSFLSTQSAPRVSMSAVRSKSRNAASSGLPPRRALAERSTPIHYSCKRLLSTHLPVKASVPSLECGARGRSPASSCRRSTGGGRPDRTGSDARSSRAPVIDAPVGTFYDTVEISGRPVARELGHGGTAPVNRLYRHRGTARKWSSTVWCSTRLFWVTGCAVGTAYGTKRLERTPRCTFLHHV
jgi:hypothetical protein